MPTYEYVCRACGHLFEIVQSMRDDALTECPECGGELRKVFAPPAISFKGSGFYATDQRKKATTSGSEKGDKGEKGEKKDKGEKKSDAGSSSGSDSGGDSGSGSGSGDGKKDSRSDAPAASSAKETSPSSSSSPSGSSSGEGSGS